MATIKLAEEFQNWANQFVDMSEAFYDLPMLDDEEVEKIAEAFCDKNGSMSQHDWEQFAEIIQGELSKKIFDYFERGGSRNED